MNISMAGIFVMLGLVVAVPLTTGTHAYASDDDSMTVGKWALGKKVGAADEVDTAINDARAQICNNDRPSAECGPEGIVLDAAEARLNVAEARSTITVVLAIIGVLGGIAPAVVGLGRH